MRDFPSAIGQLRAWIEENDWIPSDASLGWFSPYSVSAYKNGRMVLRGEGFEFKRVKGQRGWVVTKRPDPEPPMQSLPEPELQIKLPGLSDRFMSLPKDQRQIVHDAIAAMLDALGQ